MVEFLHLHVFGADHSNILEDFLYVTLSAIEYDPDREQPANLVFGRGPKSCPGLHLARRNMEVALGVLTERFPRLFLEDEDAAIPRRTVLRSPDALRVRRVD